MTHRLSGWKKDSERITVVCSCGWESPVEGRATQQRIEQTYNVHVLEVTP